MSKRINHLVQRGFAMLMAAVLLFGGMDMSAFAEEEPTGAEAVEADTVSDDDAADVDVLEVTSEGSTESNAITDDISNYESTCTPSKIVPTAAMISAQEKAWELINKYADPEYFLYRTDNCTEAQYQELKEVALKSTAECKNDYEKIKVICGFVAERIYYDYPNKGCPEKACGNPYDVYTSKKSVCCGYARLVKVLLASLGIPCMNIQAENHEYNAAYDSQNKRWIFLDATWCSNNKYTGEWEYHGYDYDYFDLAPSKIATLSNHEFYNIAGLLYKDNYYCIGYSGEWSAGNWWLELELEIGAKQKSTVIAAEGFDEFLTMGLFMDASRKIRFYSLKTLDLSNTKMTEMPSYLFNNHSIQTVIYPSTLERIPADAFYECKNLQSVDLSNTKVKEIGERAFSRCDNLSEIRLPGTLKTIGNRAFYSSEKTKTMVITDLKPEIFDANICGNRDVLICKYYYYVEFDGNGATDGISHKECFGGDTEYSLDSTNFSRIGYTLKGWNTQKDGKGQEYSITEKYKNLITEGSTITLYAQWIPNRYTVRFNGNNCTSGQMQDMNGCNYDMDYELPENTFKKEGCAFSGWSTDPDGKILYADKASIKNLTSDADGIVDLYAQWEESDYVITYHLNGGENNPKNPSGYNSNSAKIILYEPTRSGYKFDGWYSDSSFKKKISGIEKGSSGDKTLYAKWTAIKYTSTKYKVQFKKNGATSGKMSAMSKCLCENTYTLRTNKFKRKGYIFTGWNTNADGTGVSYADQESLHMSAPPDGNILTLYAQWELAEYAITYQLNDGENNTANPDSYNVKSKTIALKKPTKIGYTFCGWYKDSKYKKKVSSIKKGSTGNKTLYAKWKKTNYKITYKLNGGKNNSQNPSSFCYDTEKISLNDATKLESNFLGWYADDTFSEQMYEIPKGTTQNVTVYAKWDESQYKIVFDGNGNSNKNANMESVTCIYSGSVKLPANQFEKEGYSFAGWSTTADGSGKKYADCATVSKLSKTDGAAVTLYAQWEKTETLYKKQVVELVNKERAKEGLSAVSMDTSLNSVADLRAKEIVDKFSHTRPNGSSCFTAVTEAGISYHLVGENIAYGNGGCNTPQGVMALWMNSPGHRANILTSDYTKIGVGYYKIAGYSFWVQVFLRP